MAMACSTFMGAKLGSIALLIWEKTEDKTKQDHPHTTQEKKKKKKIHILKSMSTRHNHRII